MSELTSLGHLFFTQSKKGYRHNIDSVLLANFIKIKNSEYVLDVGSGDGIISILLKDKYPDINIFGIEIQEKLFKLSIQNSKQNNLNISYIQDDFFKFIFSENEFDIIITNPPYYPENDGRVCKDEEKKLAKHEITFNLKDFLKRAKKFLKHSGSIYFIYPTKRFLFAFNTVYENKLFLKNIRHIHNTINEDSVLTLFHVTKQKYKCVTIEKPLVIYNDKKSKSYTDEVKEYLFIGESNDRFTKYN